MVVKALREKYRKRGLPPKSLGSYIDRSASPSTLDPKPS